MNRFSPADPTRFDPLRVRFGPYVVKRADTPDEREQIHRMNFRTFVEEIPQHAPRPGRRLVDKFDHKNLYIIVKRERQVIAMVAVHDEPPFSTADRLADPSLLSQLGPALLEVRLLAVRGTERRSRVVLALLWALYRYATAAQYTHLLISGVRERLGLYRRFGFQPLGLPVQSGQAWYSPMAMPLAALTRTMRAVADRWERRLGLAPLGFGREPISLLPGPANFSERVREAFASAPYSHRRAPFIEKFEYCRDVLARLVNRRDSPALFPGGGTLANDAIAVNLAADPSLRRGLVLVNGEFGERLVDHARRAALEFDTLEWEWGQPWNLASAAVAVDTLPPDWIWGVHCETSTGVLNDLEGLKQLAAARNVRVCVDCVSSVGSVAIDLCGVHLASAASGKCIGAHAGTAIVFADPQACKSRDEVPSALDVGAAAETRGPRSTFAWGPVASLAAALESLATAELAAARYEALAAMGRFVRSELAALGVTPLAPEDSASPVVTSFRPPAGTPEEFALLCRAFGFEINAWSGYLPRRGLVQWATMGEIGTAQLATLFAQLKVWLRKAREANVA